MQTTLSPNILEKNKLQKADSILRSCVHCGFCVAVCPTYRLLGNELDSPRGRIYLIKKTLEGEKLNKDVFTHFERCLNCRSCETTCPSGVRYYELLNIVKEVAKKQYKIKLYRRTKIFLLRKFLTSGKLFSLVVKFTSIFKFILPKNLKSQLPSFGDKLIKPQNINAQKTTVLLLTGCVQQALAPNIQNATISILEKIGMKARLDKSNSCCGAIDYHLFATETAKSKIKQNIDRWYDILQTKASVIISNINGCGALIKDYPNMIADDAAYQKKLKFVMQHTMDIAEFLYDKDLTNFKIKTPHKIAYHPPCTMQHWQNIAYKVEAILEKIGFELVKIENPNICCGAAGTYSIMHKDIANRLRDEKLKDLTIDYPSEIVSSNIGCILHLKTAANLKVTHWIELLYSD